MQVVDPPRPRFSFSTEWLTAALFLIGTVLVGLLIVRELRVTPAAATPGQSTPATAAPAIPSDAVSVPTLMVGGFREIKVGDRAIDALALLGSSVRLLRQTVEQGPIGTREVRAYQLSSTEFIIVFEPFERKGELRVAAIYLQ
jgi:hypothetical protein